MDYIFSTEKFNNTFLNNNNDFSHNRSTIKCFPFTTNLKTIITDLENVTGMYLGNLLEKTPKYIDIIEFSNDILKLVEIDEDDKELFKDAIKKLYFDSNKNMIKQNIYTIIQGSYSKAYLNPEKDESNSKLIQERNQQVLENKIAKYLAEVLGNKEKNKNILNENLEQNNSADNICESLLFNVIHGKMESPKDLPVSYDKFFLGFDDIFYEDFKYIISSKKRTKEYLKMLLEFYYFSYIAQTALFFYSNEMGDRKKCSEIYFSLEWEKTSKSRKCFSNGWKTLYKNLKVIFAHEITLELLNQVESDCKYDYLKLAEIAKESEEIDTHIAREIDKIKDEYLKYVHDFSLEDTTKNDSKLKTVNSYKTLFTIVNKQFKDTNRNVAYDRFSKNIIEFCKNKFVKNRGCSGGMLNLTEEMIIFLTKLCLKDKEKLKLNDIFIAFEQRGIFLDEKSKQELDKYYEKLNIIEKKSDSGDAKYIKRIL